MEVRGEGKDHRVLLCFNSSVYMPVPISQPIPSSHLGIHTFVLYICVFISVLQVSSSIPFFQIPRICLPCIFYNSRTNRCVVVFHCGLDLHFLVVNGAYDIEHLSMNLWASCGNSPTMIKVKKNEIETKRQQKIIIDQKIILLVGGAMFPPCSLA